MSYTITETLDTLDKTGYLMIDTNAINNIKMKTEKYIPKQGELIWVWDSDEADKKLRFFNQFNKHGDILCYAYFDNILDDLDLNDTTYWHNLAKHEGVIHPHFKPQNTLLNFNQY